MEDISEKSKNGMKKAEFERGDLLEVFGVTAPDDYQ